MTKSKLRDMQEELRWGSYSDRDLKLAEGHLRKRIAVIFDPKTAFGNLELIKLEQEGVLIQRILRETRECPVCHGKGYEKHSCDCDRCEFAGEDCWNCTSGRIPNEN